MNRVGYKMYGVHGSLLLLKTPKTHANAFRIDTRSMIRAAYLHLPAASATHRQRSFSGLIPLSISPAPAAAPAPTAPRKPAGRPLAPSQRLQVPRTPFCARRGTCAGFTYADVQPSRPSVPTAFPAVQIPQNLDSATIFTDDRPEEFLSPFLSIARFCSSLSRSIAPARCSSLSVQHLFGLIKSRIRSSLLAGSPPASPPLTATPTPPGRRSLCFDPDPSPSGARRREAADCSCGSLFVLRETRSFSSTSPRFALPATSASTRTALRNQKTP